MDPGIAISNIWSDDDLVELQIVICDGTSRFSTNAYAGHSALKELGDALTRFREHVHGGLYDMRFGTFGPEYASGAFEARLHFKEPGRLFITVKAESEWTDFKGARVASNARLYLHSEPVLLDNFIVSLGLLESGHEKQAVLRCV